jgi:hypothetical protein
MQAEPQRLAMLEAKLDEVNVRSVNAFMTFSFACVCWTKSFQAPR